MLDGIAEFFSAYSEENKPTQVIGCDAVYRSWLMPDEAWKQTRITLVWPSSD